ncbi:complement resistance protein TraT [Wolinella succinogenes]|uniref:complement resistance protein TraT n=1 Tax=Wolinella succinogenes TaxID=844 RepID=UPI002FCB921A
MFFKVMRGSMAAAFSLLFLAGCATTELQTKVKMTQSVFVDPVAKDKRLIFVSMRNTSGQNINLESKIISNLQARGYTIVDDPEAATYILMANVLYCDRKREDNTTGGAAAGAVAGGAIAGYNSRSGSVGSTLGGAAAGALVGGILGKLTEDTIYQMQVDVMIKQKAKGAVLATNASKAGQASVRDGQSAGFTNSFGGAIRDTEGGAKVADNRTNYSSQQYESEYIEKQTMLFAEATKMGLTLEEAIPTLEHQMANQISGIF